LSSPAWHWHLASAIAVHQEIIASNGESAHTTKAVKHKGTKDTQEDFLLSLRVLRAFVVPNRTLQIRIA
jgi:hypothetical protein